MTTLLNISEDLSLRLEDIIGKCVAILGIRGSGKSNTAGVIFEELLRHNYPLSIIDIDGEYFGLKENYEVLVVVNVASSRRVIAKISSFSMPRIGISRTESENLSKPTSDLILSFASSERSYSDHFQLALNS